MMPTDNISNRIQIFITCISVFVLLHASISSAQPPFRGGGPPGGPNSKEEKVVKKFDADGNGMLNADERKKARVYLEKERGDRPRRGPRSRRNLEPGTPGAKTKPADVKNFPDADLFDPTVLRTLFLQFENDDWEKELALFKPTDVEVPADLTVDGKTYKNVGVSFRGASSFFMIPAGLKRSLNISMDLVEKDQRLYGYKSLNLLNCNGDASMMSSALFSYLSSQKIATPKVNFVKVVINGESWGLYVNSQQFNRIFTKEHFDSTKGSRWKVSGSPRGDGGLRYLGDEIDPYRSRFEIKSKDSEKAWRQLINLCKVLNETPADKLVESLEPIFDIDGALWFLAVDLATINSDGYWTRASDYNIYLDTHGKFHILPHDMNEAFRKRRQRRGGPRGGGPPRGNAESKKRNKESTNPDYSGFDLDPLVGLGQARMPLRSKLLSNPKLLKQYLENVRTLAELLQWDNLGPRVNRMRELIDAEVEKDSRKLFSTEEFRAATSDKKRDDRLPTLREFAEKRSAYLLNHEKIKSLPKKSK